MAPIRQIEAAELMVAMNKYSISYAKSLVAATPQDQLVETDKAKGHQGPDREQIALMERESANLEREFKIAETILWRRPSRFRSAKGYLGTLLGNARVVRYLRSIIAKSCLNSRSLRSWKVRRLELRQAARSSDGGSFGRLWGPGPDKRGDRGRSRTVGRIKRGGGDGGEPVRSPLG